jgi:hypothetical protein
MPMALPSVEAMTDAERKELAESLGYKSIGKELPDDVTLTQIIKSMPAEVRCSTRLCVFLPEPCLG